MIAASHQHKMLLTCFQNRRWDGDFLTLKKLMADNTLGRVKWIEMAYQKGVSTRQWKTESVFKGGGRFWDLGSHMVDQFLMLFPHLGVKSVYCRMLFDVPQMAEVDSHALVIIELEDGTTGICDANSFTSIEKPRFYVVGDKATYIKYGSDPQEDAMMSGNIDGAVEDEKSYGTLTYREKPQNQNAVVQIPTLPGRWRCFL